MGTFLAHFSLMGILDQARAKRVIPRDESTSAWQNSANHQKFAMRRISQCDANEKNALRKARSTQTPCMGNISCVMPRV